MVAYCTVTPRGAPCALKRCIVLLIWMLNFTPSDRTYDHKVTTAILAGVYFFWGGEMKRSRTAIWAHPELMDRHNERAMPFVINTKQYTAAASQI